MLLHKFILTPYSVPVIAGVALYLLPTRGRQGAAVGDRAAQVYPEDLGTDMLAHWGQTTQHKSQAVLRVKVDYRQGLQVLDLCLPGTSTLPGLTSAAGTERCADSYLLPTTLLFPAETT